MLKLDYLVEFLKAAGELYNQLTSRTVEHEIYPDVSLDELRLKMILAKNEFGSVLIGAEFRSYTSYQ